MHGVVQRKLKRGEVYGFQSNNGIKPTKWKDKRNVLMTLTKPSHSATLGDIGKTNQANERIMKPSVVLDNNKGKQGIDLSDELSPYYTLKKKDLSPNPPKRFGRWKKLPNEFKCRKMQ